MKSQQKNKHFFVKLPHGKLRIATGYDQVLKQAPFTAFYFYVVDVIGLDITMGVDIFPFFHASAIVYGGLLALCKRAFADTCNAARHIYPCERRTVRKRVLADGGYFLGDGYERESTGVKRVLSDACDRDGDGKGRAVYKGIALGVDDKV